MKNLLTFNLFLIFIFVNGADKWLPFFHDIVYLSETKASYSGSVQSCISKNASLIILKNQNERDYITKLLDKNKGYRIAYRKTSNGWEWENNSTYFPSSWWQAGDPSTVDTTAYFLFKSGKWVIDGHNDFFLYNFICQIKVWEKLNEDEKMKMCGVEFMPNCSGQSCFDVCEKYPGCSSVGILSNTCINVKDKLKYGQDCCIDIFNVDVYSNKTTKNSL